MPFYNEPDLDDVKKLQEIKDAIYSLRIETFSESSLSYPQQDEGETEHHIIQLRFDLERLWGKLRVRQVCKTREALVQLLRQSQISDTTNTALSPAPPEFQFLDSARLDEFHLQHQQSSFPLCLYRESPRSEPTETVWLPWARAVNPPKGMILVQANFSIPRYVPPRMDDDEEEEEEEEEDDVWDRERNEGDNYEDDDYYSREYQNDFHVHEQQ